MYKRIIAAGLTAVMGTAAFGQDDLVFNISNTRACLQDAISEGARRNCIGTSADMCMNATQGGGSTYGMGGCLSFEADWWDAQLNIAYRDLMRREKSDDVDSAQYEYIPKKAPALRDMQRAWITFRDATCTYEYSQWGGGTGGGPANTACIMRMTGEQTLYLQSGFQDY